MAFGDPRSGSPLKNNSTSPGTGITASGSISFQSGDLIIILYVLRTALTITVTDNLSGSYTALNAGTTNNARQYPFFRVASSSGTLTSVSGSHSSTSADAVIIGAVFEGSFASSALDANPTTLSDNTSPYTCPATGVLTQADELVLGFQSQGNGGTVAGYGANNGFTIHGAETSGTGANTLSGAMCYLAVSSTASVTPEVTQSFANTGGHAGTASFKKQLVSASLVFNPFAQFAHMLVR